MVRLLNLSSGPRVPSKRNEALRSPSENLAATPDPIKRLFFFIVPHGRVSLQFHDEGAWVRTELGLNDLEGLGEIFASQVARSEFIIHGEALGKLKPGCATLAFRSKENMLNSEVCRKTKRTATAVKRGLVEEYADRVGRRCWCSSRSAFCAWEMNMLALMATRSMILRRAV